MTINRRHPYNNAQDSFWTYLLCLIYNGCSVISNPTAPDDIVYTLFWPLVQIHQSAKLFTIR